MPFHTVTFGRQIVWVQERRERSYLAVWPGATPDKWGAYWVDQSWPIGPELPVDEVKTKALIGVINALGDDAPAELCGELAARKLLEEDDDA